MQPATHVLGLDVGPPGEPTGFAILERPAYEKPPSAWEYHLRHAERFAPGTSYPAIIDSVVQRAKAATISGRPLLVDQTAVGQAFIRPLRQAKSGLSIHSIAVSAGQTVQKAEDGTQLVPKRDLVMALQMTLQTRRLKIAPELAEATLLMAELAGFRLRSVPVSETANIEWREGRHDDLVFAVALTVWHAERSPPTTFAPYTLGGAFEVDKAPRGVFND